MSTEETRDPGDAHEGSTEAPHIDREMRVAKQQALVAARKHQPGIGFPSAGVQKSLLIVRLNLARADGTPESRLTSVRDGLMRLCDLFARIDSGKKRIEVIRPGGAVELVSLREEFHFSATVAFGQGFFDLLSIPKERRPAKLREMPDHTTLRDPTPYSLGQTDLLVQLGASEEFINRWVYENDLQPPASPAGVPQDIVSAVAGWATVTDLHAGFQRVDGRNLQGFNDGVSNPRRLSPLFDEIVWTTRDDETNHDLLGGTYMVFQKIVHDLDQWRALDVDEQQEWVGRHKVTGLLLGTLPDEDHEVLAQGLVSTTPSVRAAAVAKWKPLFEEQSDPQKRFFNHVGHDPDGVPSYKVHGKASEVPSKCPVWAHVRKVNPRREDDLTVTVGGQSFPLDEHLIFRRGYPFVESGPDNKHRSGLLFVCFQRDIGAKFEFLKQTWLNNPEFLVPTFRPFNKAELATRHQHGRFTVAELDALTAPQREALGLAAIEAFEDAKQNAAKPATQNAGREGLAGPSELGVTPTGEFLAIVPLGGGYYFVPPIPGKDIAQIGQQFFA